MRYALLSAALIMALASCQKSEQSEEVKPGAITAAFNQDFTLNYRQQAMLSSATQPELTVEVADIQYAICPKNARCFVANFVFPTLLISDAQGRTQQLLLPVNHKMGLRSGPWIDTASVQANGRRYLLQYTDWNIETICDQPEKKDIALKLHVRASMEKQ